MQLSDEKVKTIVTRTLAAIVDAHGWGQTESLRAALKGGRGEPQARSVRSASTARKCRAPGTAREK